MKLVVAAFIAATALVRAADKTPDLTAASAKMFKSQVGHTISIRGRLEHGKQGACLFGATPAGVYFYIIPDAAPGGFVWPTSWTKLIRRQVRVTGELKFRFFDRSRAKPGDQTPADYYYMVLQRTNIQRVVSK